MKVWHGNGTKRRRRANPGWILKRSDGSRLTTPSHASRKAKSRARNCMAKASRRANRGKS